jgi:hypothetical protein
MCKVWIFVSICFFRLYFYIKTFFWIWLGCLVVDILKTNFEVFGCTKNTENWDSNGCGNGCGRRIGVADGGDANVKWGEGGGCRTEEKEVVYYRQDPLNCKMGARNLFFSFGFSIILELWRM